MKSAYKYDLNEKLKIEILKKMINNDSNYFLICNLFKNISTSLNI